MEIFILFVLFTAVIAFFVSRNAKREKALKQKQEQLMKAAEYEQLSKIERLGAAAQDCAAKVQSVKTPGAKLNNIQKALDYINEALEYPECEDIIGNVYEVKARLEAMQRVLPLISIIEKAHKSRFKGKDKAELGALQDALYEIRMKEITNAEIDQAQVYPEGTGEIVTIESIQDRCRKLGWEPA